MGLWDKLLGRKATNAASESSQSPHDQPNAHPPTIQAFDAYDRPIEIQREEWRTKVLPGMFRENWNDPDKLTDTIYGALRDGFDAEACEAAERLTRIDPNPIRAATLLGVSLLQLHRYADAQRCLEDALQKHGRDGLLLTNLAKAQSGLGNESLAQATLWQALQVDPNQDNGLLWYSISQREQGGEEAQVAALTRVAELPNSWRAQLWLARRALEHHDLRSAIRAYRVVLERAQPLGADVLMQISGDLGNQGQTREIVDLCAPHFDVNAHGLQVGNNLIKAYVELRDSANARQLLELLYAQQRPDWQQHLLYWDAEIDKLEKHYGPVPSTGPISVQFLRIDGPLWARPNSPFGSLLTAKQPAAPSVAFLCGTAAIPAPSKVIVKQLPDACGRFTRSLPLFLTEEVYLRTAARAECLITWMSEGGFVLAGEPWHPEDSSQFDCQSEYLVLLHILARQEPWSAEFTLLRTADRKQLASWKCAVDPQHFADSIAAIATQTLSELQKHATIAYAERPKLLLHPTGQWLPEYLLGLEASLSVACAKLVPGNNDFLYAERSIIDHALHLCVHNPDNVATRLLLLHSLEKEAQRRPDIAAEYRERIEPLQREHPIQPPAQHLADAAVARIYSHPQSAT